MTKVTPATSTSSISAETKLEKREVKEIKKDYSDEFLHTPFEIFIPDTGEEIEIFFLGCADNGLAGQIQVAELMNKVAEQNRRSPHLLVFLGDMFTANGITPDRKNYNLFYTHFHNVYQSPSYPWINKVPCIIIPGNHDINAHDGVVDYDRLKMQILHSYIDLTTQKPDPTKLAFVAKGQIPFDVLQKNRNPWNMLKRFGRICIGDRIEMHCVDTDTLPQDYEDRAPQALWLDKVNAENPEKTKLSCAHHGALPNNSKRNLPEKYCDAKDYLSSAIIEKLTTELKEAKIIKPDEKASFNQILRHKTRHLHYQTCFVAHDHSNGCKESKEAGDDICQITAGGAGGEIHERYYYGKLEETRCFMAEPGFVYTRIAAGPNPIVTSDFYTVPGMHLRYAHRSGALTRFPRTPPMEMLSNMVIRACREYQTFLSKITLDPLVMRGKIVPLRYPEFLRQSDQLQNYFNRVEAPDLMSAIVYLASALSASLPPDTFAKKLARKIDNALFMGGVDSLNNEWYRIFNQKLTEVYHLTYQEFIANPTQILTTSIGPFVEFKTSQFPAGTLKEMKETRDSLLTVTTTSTSVPPHAHAASELSLTSAPSSEVLPLAVRTSSPFVSPVSIRADQGESSRSFSPTSLDLSTPSFSLTHVSMWATTSTVCSSPLRGEMEKKEAASSEPINIPAKKTPTQTETDGFTPGSALAVVLASQPLTQYMLFSPPRGAAVSPVASSLLLDA